MKSKIKRHSRSALAVILTLSMLVSCMMVGLIATDAAKVTDSGTVGAQENSEDVGAMIDDTDSAVGAQENSDNVGDGETIASGSTLIVNSGCYGNTTLYAYFYGGTATDWVPLTRITSGNFEGKYYCTVPAGSPTNVIICKMNGNGSGWDNRLNQTDNASLSGNYVIVNSTYGSSSSYVDGKDYKKETVSVSAKEFKVFVRNGSSDNHSVEESYFLTNDNGSGVFSITTPSIVAADNHFEVKNYNYNNGGTDVWYGESGNYWLNDTVVGNSYTVTASVDIKNVSTSDWTGSTFSKTLVSSNSSYSLTGNIDSTYVAQINGVTNTITRGSEENDVWWAKYQENAAISTAESGTNVYSITITTVDAATLAANNHSDIDIGLSMKGNYKKGFNYGGTDYNTPGEDYKVTSAGMTNASILDNATGGSFQLQPGRTYKITVDETNKKLSVACDSGDKYFLAGQYSDGTPYFFGTVWKTSNNELTETSSGSGVYEKTFTSDIPAGTINFKVVKNGDSDGWSDDSWPTDGNQSYVIKANATSVKFSFSTSTKKTTVTQENSSSSGGGEWEPSTPDAIKGHLTDKSNDDNTTVIYAFSTGSNAIVSGSIKTPKMVGSAYWVDFSDLTSELSSVNTTQGYNLYLALTSGNNWSSIYTASGTVTFNNQTYSLGVSSGGVESYNSGDIHYFARVSFENPNTISHLGVLISKPEATKHDFKVYTTAQPPAPVVETQVVDIYAKDATLRDDTFNRFARLATTTIDSSDAACFEYTDEDGVTYSSIKDYNTAKDPDIVITRESYGGTDAGYTKMTNVPVGAKVKIKTTLSSNASAQGSFDNKAFKETHYVKGYSFNGVTYQINEWESDGVYEEIWTVRAVNTTYKDSNDVLQNATTGGKVVEVTPIYYMKDNTNCKTFYIDGYDGTVQNAWGNMLAVYPYYEGKSNKDNAFGGYPGQPMLLWGGKYQMEIPLTVDGTASGASVKGLTLHNAYWDLLHRSIDIRCNARNHAQTYDYDDFYKLYKEKNPDTIIFDFKYKTANDNFGDSDKYFNYEFAGTSGNEPTKDAAHYAASGKNGVEIVTDYFGRQVDVFGNLLTDAQKSDYDASHPQDKELLIVSTGYKDTYVGEYATLWAVYAPQSGIPSGSNDTAGKFIGLISSSELYLNTWENTSKYPVSDHGLLMTDSRFENTYKHLKEYYTGVPALITYDKEIWNDSKDKANRSDGKWYYSNKSDKISASIKIQYGAYSLYEAPDHSVSSDAWNDDPFNQSKTGVGGYNNIGTNTGCSAYFTNTTPNLKGKVASGEQFADSTKKFTFQAVPSGSYMFAGWVRYSNGKYYEISEKEAAESPMSANDVYIARFVDAQTGSLTIQHVTEKTDTFNGTGTPSVTVSVKNASGTEVFTDTKEDGSKIDISNYINSHFKDYKIDISLTTTPDTENFMKEIVSSSGNFAPGTSKWNEDKTPTNSAGADTTAKTVSVEFTVQDILDSGVTSLRYVSHLMMPKYTYNYEITYTYYSRFWGEQSYTVTGTFANDSEFSSNTTGSKNTAKLNTDFIINKTPYEKTFRQKIDWNYTDSEVTAAAGNTANHGASAMVNNAAGVPVTTNTYKMTAHVYASNTVNDRVTAEFVLPYKYDTKANGYAALQGDMYQTAEQEHDVDLEHTYIYDTSYESFKLTTQAYKLFTYDDAIHSGSDSTLASSLPLIEAAPYVIKDSDYHYYYTTKERYFSSSDDAVAGEQSFKIGDNKYWLNNVPDGQSGTALTAESTATFNGTPYNYAILIDHGTPSVYDDELYRFVNVGQDNVQYTYTSWVRTIDGIVKNSSGSKLFFTRWDIFNTKGDLVASCYNRRFNYSGYDNYVVKPVYDTEPDASGNNPNTYASSTGDGYKSQITFLDDSRNQWNNGASGSYNSVTHLSDAEYAGDKIFADFAITYAYEGRNINTVSSNEAKIRVGMVIEKLDALDTAGSTTISDASYYANKYKGDTDWEALSTALASGTSLTTAVRSAGGASSAEHSCFNSKIAANYEVAGYTQFGNPAPGAISGQESVVDNFNRLQWFYTFNNSTKATAEATEVEGNMKNYAFRAISYIIVEENGTTTATLTDTPVYFTIYDTATRAHN